MRKKKYFEKVWDEIQEEKKNPELRRQHLERDLREFELGLEFERLKIAGRS